jgi:hypothetical protein
MRRLLAPLYARGFRARATKKSGLSALLIATVFAFGAATNAAKAVTYTLSGTVINSPEAGMSFQFVYTTPTFITTTQQVTLDSCSTSSSAYACSGLAFFRPAELKDFPNPGDQWDQIDFEWVNTDNSGGGAGQLLFALGAFTAPGVYNVGPISISSDAVLTVSDVATTPLPAALPLFATGLGAMGLLGWRRKRKNSKPPAV